MQPQPAQYGGPSLNDVPETKVSKYIEFNAPETSDEPSLNLIVDVAQLVRDSGAPGRTTPYSDKLATITSVRVFLITDSNASTLVLFATKPELHPLKSMWLGSAPPAFGTIVNYGLSTPSGDKYMYEKVCSNLSLPITLEAADDRSLVISICLDPIAKSVVGVLQVDVSYKPAWDWKNFASTPRLEQFEINGRYGVEMARRVVPKKRPSKRVDAPGHTHKKAPRKNDMKTGAKKMKQIWKQKTSKTTKKKKLQRPLPHTNTAASLASLARFMPTRA